jgi:hypothetical protein
MDTYRLYIGEETVSRIVYIGLDYREVHNRALKLQADIGKTVFIDGEI